MGDGSCDLELDEVALHYHSLVIPYRMIEITPIAALSSIHIGACGAP